MSKRKSFIFGETLREQLRHIPQDEKFKFLNAIVAYGMDGIDIVFESKDQAIWLGMKAHIDLLNKKHYKKEVRND
jgi:hypothetical protein